MGKSYNDVYVAVQFILEDLYEEGWSVEKAAGVVRDAVNEWVDEMDDEA